MPFSICRPLICRQRQYNGTTKEMCQPPSQFVHADQLFSSKLTSRHTFPFSSARLVVPWNQPIPTGRVLSLIRDRKIVKDYRPKTGKNHAILRESG